MKENESFVKDFKVQKIAYFLKHILVIIAFCEGEKENVDTLCEAWKV